MEYCIKGLGISKLSAFQTQTRHDIRKIGDPSQDIVFLLEEI